MGTGCKKDRTFNQFTNPCVSSIQETINGLQDFLSEEIVECIEQNFKLFNSIIKTFKEYENIVNCHGALINLADSLIADSIAHLNDYQNPNIEEAAKTSRQLVSLFRLKDLANKLAYLKMIRFMRDILNNPNKEEILFSDVVHTEEGINKRYRKLALYFHPDKTTRHYTPPELQDEYKNLGVELFKCVSEFKKKLLLDLEQPSKFDRLTFHEEKANEFWKIAVDYRNAHKAQWDKIRILKKEDLKETPPEQLRSASVSNGQLAYKEYRAACQLADRDKQFKSQLKLRGYMALSLYISNQFIEAQLCAISAINLIYRNTRNATRQDLNEALKIYYKVKDGNPNESENTPRLNTETEPVNNSLNRHYSKAETLDDELSFFDKKTIHRSINEDLEKISTDLMLKADRRLVRYQASREGILCAKKRVHTHKAVGTAAMTGAAVGGVLTVATGFEVCKEVFVGSILLGGPVLGVCSGISMIFFGLWGGYRLWKKGTALLEEPKTREALNDIMKKALIAYDQGNYQSFFDELSKEYKSGISLLTLKRRGDSINHERIIEALLMHGFRSDGIAYLLNLIGEVLIRGKVKIEDITADELKTQGANVLTGVLTDKLVEEAQELDSRIQELRNKSVKRIFNQLADWFLIREYSIVAKEHEDDAKEMPFVSRLEEMRNTARINLVIRDIMNGGPEEIKRAKRDLEEVRVSINKHHQFIGIAQTRLEVLEDFLWILTGEEPSRFQLDFPVDP